MKKLTATICLTLAVLLGSAGMSESAEPINGVCLPGNKHFHYPTVPFVTLPFTDVVIPISLLAAKCSASYEAGDYETALREFQPLAE